jgi:hypothetical protein
MGILLSISVLIACEESGVVTQAFRDLGVDAWSCDVLPTSGRLPQYHIQEPLDRVDRTRFGALIGFPPCTHLASSGARWFKDKQKDGRQQAGIDFFMDVVDNGLEYMCVENPIGIMSTQFRKPDQIIQPWMFGHGETKSTCLWLRGFPPLIPTNIVDGREARIHKMPPSPERSKLRSKTYQGIACAMADQWSPYLL